MQIGITGISGYIGQLISRELSARGHTIIGINRNLLYGIQGDLKSEIEGCDIIINLAGASILKRWNRQNKELIYNSRIITTQNLVRALNGLPGEKQPKKLISASAIGIYKSGFNHDESSINFDNRFLGKVVKDWEACLDELPEKVQKIIFRTGLVLGRNSKIIKNQRIPFSLGLGATLGNGNQPLPFIHESDLINAFAEAVEDEKMQGIYNLVAPDKVTNRDFTKCYAKNLNRPAWFSIPEFLIRLILCEAAVLLTESPEVEPKRLINKGFVFKFPTIEKTLESIISRKER